MVYERTQHKFNYTKGILMFTPFDFTTIHNTATSLHVTDLFKELGDAMPGSRLYLLKDLTHESLTALLADLNTTIFVNVPDRIYCGGYELQR